MTFREEIIGDCRLILGDCREVLPTLGKVDAVVTDPPYGVMLGEMGHGDERRKNQQSYSQFSDTPDYVKEIVIPAIEQCISIANCCLVTCGNRHMQSYPKWDDFGVWWNPAGTSRGKWGFQLAVTPILYYGKDPRAGKNQYASSLTGHFDRSETIDHPCPKPLPFMKWLVRKASLETQVVLDPFMGSGTTGVACVKLGRKFIGIEIDEGYFNIACDRIRKAYAQPDMFISPPAPKPVQDALL